MGTVGYMSPEQATGGEVDFRSDQFSFGSVLFEMVTGFAAFRKTSHAETMAAILRDEPERLGPRMLQAPAPFIWIVERCLAKDPKASLRLHPGFGARPGRGARSACRMHRPASQNLAPTTCRCSAPHSSDANAKRRLCDSS